MTAASSNTVAFCGTRGVPARYGGFETAADEITRRLAGEGVACEVFCRGRDGGDRPHVDHERRLTYVKGSRVRTLDTVVSSLQTGWYLVRHRRRYAYVFWFNNANMPGILLTRLARIPMAVNTDGLEWRRAKWSWPFKLYHYLSAFVTARVSPALIADSLTIQSYYRRRFGADSHFIPYGTPAMPAVSADRARELLAGMGLAGSRYFLQITRFEPDNLPLEAGRAFQQSGLERQGFSMVIVGYQGGPRYAERVKELDGRAGIRVLDAVYDPTMLRVLREHCFGYVHGNSVGGTNPALLEAMACCPRVLAIDSPFSREVMADTGLFFDPRDMAPAFATAVQTPEQGPALKARVQAGYDWDAVARSYRRLADGHPPDYPAEIGEGRLVSPPAERAK